MDGVVLAKEDITEDPQRTSRGGDIKANEAEEAEAAGIDGVVETVEEEVLSAELEVDLGKLGAAGAVDEVLAGVDGGGADGIGEAGDFIGGTSHEGGTGVEDGLVDLGHEGVVVGHGSELNLPVGLGGEGNPAELTLVLGVVNAANVQSAVRHAVLGEVEREDGLLHEALLEHTLEHGGDLAHGEGAEAHAEDTVELADGVSETKAGGVSDLGEGLRLDDEATHVDGVLGEEAGDGARAVHDLELGAISNVGGGGAVVVTGVGAAAAALGVRDPQVGGASVEDDLELGAIGADLDGTVVLRTKEQTNGWVVGERRESRKRNKSEYLKWPK